MEKIENLARIKSIIWIYGPSGSGKTRLARKIHNISNRKRRPFIEVNLGSLPDQLIESTLFGHIQGSFTGASKNQQGYLEKINNGTLFLDEIGEISKVMQLKLLKVLDEKKYTPVGATIEKNFEGTIIVATNKDLEKMVAQGEFREDLYYRIKAFKVNLPKLNSSLEYKLGAIKNIFKDSFYKLSDLQIEQLKNYHFPGNFRELKYIFEYFTLLNRLPELKKEQENESNYNKLDRFHLALESFEKEYLYNALKQNNGKINKTSEKIGLNKVTLSSKIKKYKIKHWEMRAS